MIARLLALIAFVFSFTACFVASSGTPTPDGGTTASVTFHKDVEPIFQKHCDSCHSPGGVAPFSLVGYGDAQPYAQDIVLQTQSKKMPPWGARNTSECTTRSGWKEDPSLSDSELQTISDWVTQGAAEGNASDAPPPFTAPTSGLPNEQIDLAPPSGYVFPANVTGDQFVCYVLDPKITTTSYINGTAVLPGNSLIVHHAVIFADPQRQSLGQITNQAQQSYPCFGGTNVPSSTLVAAWAPGGMPHEYAPDIGMPITPGSLLVMQIHYHAHTTDPKNQDPDVTHLQLRYTQSAPQYYAVSKIIGNFSDAAQGLQSGPDDPNGVPVFDIPANVTGHTETMVYTVPNGLTGGKPAWVYSVGGHMHLVGDDIKVSLDRKAPTGSNPADECLMQIPAWDFYWQRQYDYAITDVSALPSIASGDKLTIRCTYDNTMNNPALASELAEQNVSQPQDVHLGESTLDEMCLALVTVVVPAN
jgi:hypothetical protein